MIRLSALFALLATSLAASPSLAADADAASRTGRIPKIIIQTSKSSNIDRSDWIEYQTSVRTVNPEYDLQHYSDEEARFFIATHYGGTPLEHAYEISTPIMRADLFRLAAIYELGGFYMDMDMLAKSSLDPIVDAINDGEYGAAFPKEWWWSEEFYGEIFPGHLPEDPEDHWQMGQYAMAAVPRHPFIKAVLEEAIVRSINLMSQKGDAPETIRDEDVLATTGPYLFTELYHAGRKAGKYVDVHHLAGDSSPPLLDRRGAVDWHKFGKYAEHMLSHTWVSPERRKLETYGKSSKSQKGGKATKGAKRARRN